MRDAKITTATTLNDVHSRLNPARPAWRAQPRDQEELQRAIAQARHEQLGIAVCGGRHAMGGQQFLQGGAQIDMSGMNHVHHFDAQRGLLRVAAGIQWPQLMRWLDENAENKRADWGIRQKQTGADRFSLGGCLGANIHGRGLTLAPFAGDIESFVLIRADGEAQLCSRDANAELFRHAIGGYGLFGVVSELTLRLAPRKKVRREVEIVEADSLMQRFTARIADGCLYGDFQFATDSASPDFLHRGILSCYREVASDTPLTPDPLHLQGKDWQRLLYLAHADKSRAFVEFADFYMRSHGQVYRSDDHQAGYYFDDYHDSLDSRLGHVGSEVITELYVPPARLTDFLAAAAACLRRLHADVIYGTVRLVERDDETMLAWASEAFACVILNLHTPHTADGKALSAAAFSALIDLAIAYGGSFYLTYHRHATRAQVLACYAQFPEFLAAKRQHDPQLAFRSDWYRHYQAVFEDACA
jgi:FAD/FMN-containing dehydrogenase